jgi:tetratricopeptide (TPR) repeat protein
VRGLAAFCAALLAVAAPAVAQGGKAAPRRAARPAREHESVRALLQLAKRQAAQKDAPGALASLRRALELAPNSEEALTTYAQISLGVRTPLPAILALEPLTRMCPTVAQYPYLLGVAYMQAGDMPAAVEALREAEQLEPNRVMTLVALGLALNHRKLYAEAKPLLLRGLEIEPDSVEVVAALAESEEGLGELEQAEAHATRALGKAPGHGTANLVIGMLRMKQGRYAEARDAFEKAVAADPGGSKPHYQLSLAYARLDDPAASQKHLALYQQRLKEIEERLVRMRQETGRPADGGQR